MLSNKRAKELVNKYGTPLFVYSKDIILDKINELRENFLEKHDNTEAVYAGKAFLCKEMCRILKRENMSLDVVSGGELYTAMSVEFPENKIYFHGNNKTIEEIKTGVEYGVNFIVDNENELNNLIQITDNLNKKINILFRVSPGVEAHTHKYIITGNVDSKFGFQLNDYLLKVLKKAINSNTLNFMGFHFHIGSQLFDVSPYIEAIKKITEYAKRIKKELNYDIKILDVGGGFGIKYTDETEPKINFFTDKIMETVQNEFKSKELIIPKILIEPGRWLIGKAGMTLYKIGTIKEIPDVRKYVSVDGGMTDNIRPALYGSNYDAVVFNDLDKNEIEKITLAGKCCESGDILIKDIELPKLKTNDIIGVLSTGAYCYSMSSNYNKLPKPAVVMINGSEDKLIIKRQSYEKMIEDEL
ncbi:diaminopimelate decarboxylase [Tepiditoga spiralis]|uniref:Diaminopimelate decarboxylase n=1 Tax=Tepiditoga spiralis TaxID=2108365 RepID=A0A7G1G821_9BACT|nr:diaminopimelate decarboxylase [Tepiditoga spiralis]BBE31053.1 diaminopimelate decarboxylase [Tepiditoga spiralis]